LLVFKPFSNGRPQELCPVDAKVALGAAEGNQFGIRRPEAYWTMLRHRKLSNVVQP
jgi:hypothetical protein